MVQNLFLSHRMDSLVERLIDQLDKDSLSPLQGRTILVPNGQVKQWLLLEIAKRKGIAMGLKIVTIEEMISSGSFLETFCCVYDSLRAAKDPDLQGYLEKKTGRMVHLAGELSTLFSTYVRYGGPLFEGVPIDWQHAMLQKLFSPLRMPEPQPVICFGMDELPPAFWEQLFRAPLSIYLFSPCVDFWEDLCSDRERKGLNRYWKKKGAAKANRDQLDIYLRDAPRNLANWGKLGRETLKILDRFDLQMEEVYPPLEPGSLLKQLQAQLLYFQEPQTLKPDASLKVFLTGSSRLKEIECLREEILRLNIPYQEISVLAPDIEPYVPLIEFVFGDIPYRISGFDIAPQSSFRHGLMKLLHLPSGRWEAEELLSLFETAAFYRKQGWDAEHLDRIRTWIETTRIKWGFDEKHRREILSRTLGEKTYEDQNSWEKGLDRLLDAVVYLLPMQVNADLLEEFVVLLSSLKKLPLIGEKTLASWADSLEAAMQEFLLPDLSDEADVATSHSFRQFLNELRQSQSQAVFPFEVIQRLLLRPCSGQIHASQLHAVRFAAIEGGALLPAKALFLIGMDEGSFPRIKVPSSLDLLKRQKISIPETADRDRYLFLQAFFSAVDFLRISYGHLSADEGKPVGPSLLVQELLNVAPREVAIVYHTTTPLSKELPTWLKSPSGDLPEGEITISFSDLRLLARHPWKFFLQKVQGMYLNEPLEDSFALQKGQLLRLTLEKPLEQVLATADLPSGSLGEALKAEIADKAAEWQDQLSEWQLAPFPLIFRENCTQMQWEGASCIVPPIELTFAKLKVRLVGEIKHATAKGLLSANDDNIAGSLKVWPEALAVAVALNAPQIWMLKNGKCKNLENPSAHLKAFIEYYFRCLATPSPLLPDWSDALLRKGSAELEKKIRKGSMFEDPVIEWVLARFELPTADQIVATWSAPLKETFNGLLSLYPTRGKS